MGLSDAQLEALFHEMDLNHDGSIDASELQIALHKVGRDTSLQQVQKIIDQFDVDHNRTLEMEEFKHFMRYADTAMQVNVPGRLHTLYFNVNFNNALRTLAAGAVAGAISRTCVAPMERLKIIFQTQVQLPGQVPKYHGVVQSLRLIWREEGVAGMFRGNGINVLRIAPTSAIQFLSFELYKRLWIQWTKQERINSIAERLICGGLTGITALVLTYPLDFLRARITIQNTASEGLWHSARSVVRVEGLRGLYRGMLPSILGSVPYVGIDFAVYDTLKRHIPRKEDGTLPTVHTLAAGALAGSIGQTVAYPIDLVRRRLQVQTVSSNMAAQQHIEHYGGMWDAFRKIYRQEGIAGFYRGLTPNYIKVIPALAISFASFEKLKEALSPPRHRVKKEAQTVSSSSSSPDIENRTNKKPAMAK